MARGPTVVWMVHALTGRSGVKGDLSLTREAIVFRAETSRYGVWTFPYERVRKVRRALGGPVLEVALGGSEGPRIVGFYFVEPPSLERGAGLLETKGRVRRRAIAQLYRGNATKREEIRRWVEAITERVEDVRRRDA